MGPTDKELRRHAPPPLPSSLADGKGWGVHPRFKRQVVIYIAIALVVFLGVNLYAVPRFKDVFADLGVTLPALTMAAITLADLARQSYAGVGIVVLAFVGLAAGCFALSLWRPRLGPWVARGLLIACVLFYLIALFLPLTRII